MSDRGWQHSILQGIGARTEVFAELHPRPYLLFMTLFALLGYACLLLFPLLVLASLAGSYRALAASPGVAWLPLLVWVPVAGFSGLISYRLARFRPSLPTGIVLDRRQAPGLYRLLEEMRAHYACPGIDRIVITGRYQLDIVCTPVTVLPVWSTRSLLVGLPLLRCLSMTRFQCSLARRTGQYSRRSNRLLNWLYALRSTWSVYREPAFGKDPACLPVRAIFSVYAPLYTLLSTVAARLDELQADSYSMEMFSDEDVLDSLTTDVVYRLFLRERYWPAIRKLSERDATVARHANARIAAVLHTGLQAGNIPDWVEQAMSTEQQWDDPWPSLVRRIENIGHAHAGMITDIIEPLAEGYLDTSRTKLEALLEDLPPPQIPQLPSLQQGMNALLRTLESAVRSLLHRLKNLLPSRGHVGEVEH